MSSWWFAEWFEDEIELTRIDARASVIISMLEKNIKANFPIEYKDKKQKIRRLSEYEADIINRKIVRSGDIAILNEFL